jgi:hypothetical protein
LVLQPIACWKNNTQAIPSDKTSIWKDETMEEQRGQYDLGMKKSKSHIFRLLNTSSK